MYGVIWFQRARYVGNILRKKQTSDTPSVHFTKTHYTCSNSIQRKQTSNNFEIQQDKKKGGVDEVDRLKVNYSIARSSWRWTLSLFFVLLNLAGINSHILVVYRLNTNANTGRRHVLRRLMKDLVYKQARWRLEQMQVPERIRTRIHTLFPIWEGDVQPAPRTRAEGRCYLDTRKEHRASKTTCEKCENFICTSHRVTFCTRSAQPTPQEWIRIAPI